MRWRRKLIVMELGAIYTRTVHHDVGSEDVAVTLLLFIFLCRELLRLRVVRNLKINYTEL